MNVQTVVNRTIEIVNLANNPEPIKCIRLVNNLLLSEDPISKLAYKLAKSELSSAMEIIENFEHEGDVRGALNRILSHLESAFTLALDYYSKNNGEFNLVNGLVQMVMSKKIQTVYDDIVKICYYQLICHKLLGSSEERLFQIISHVPVYTDCTFEKYTEAMSKLFNEELWGAIITIRAAKYIKNMESIAKSFENPFGFIFNR